MCTKAERDKIVDFISQRTGSSCHKVFQTMQGAALLLDTKLRQGESLRIQRERFTETIGATLCVMDQLPTPTELVRQINREQ